MRGIPAKRGLKSGLLLACVLTAGLGLTACSDLDNMFDDSNSDISASDAAAPTATGGTAMPAPTAEAPPSLASGGAPVATITPVTIDPGSDTGTQVNKTIQTLRDQMAGLENKLAANAARLADLRNNGAGAAGAYQESKARITTRLQVGTTKGNPELVSEWNSAQILAGHAVGQHQSAERAGHRCDGRFLQRPFRARPDRRHLQCLRRGR